MRKKKTQLCNKAIYTIACICICLYIFFPFFKYRMYMGVISISLFLVLAFCESGKRWNVNLDEILFLVILIYSFFSTSLNLINSSWSSTGRSIFLGFWLSFLMYYFNSCLKNRCQSLVMVLNIFSLLFMIATYLQFFNVGLLQRFVNTYLSDSSGITSYRAAQEWGSYYGLASTNFENAFFISVFCGGIIAVYFCEKKIWSEVLYLIGIGAILLSGKRSIILANILVMLICLGTIKKIKISIRVIKKYLITLGIGAFCLFYINKITNVFNLIIYKTNAVTKHSSILNGREDMYSQLLSLIDNKILCGHGLGSVYSIFSDGAHNIYLQLLYELGLVGLVLFCVFFLYNLKNAFVAMKYFQSGEKKFIAIFSFYLQMIFLIYGFFGNPLFYNSSLIIYFISVSILKSIRREKNENCNFNIQ